MVKHVFVIDFNGENIFGNIFCCPKTTVKTHLVKCLSRTTVKISFPDLRNELFVNILGYKEPNLIHLWRCKVFLHDHGQDDDDDDNEDTLGVHLI